MISERKLISSHSSFWQAVLPMGAAFVRTMNTDLSRFAPPRPSVLPATRNAFISELGFRIYAATIDGAIDLGADQLANDRRVLSLAEGVQTYIAQLEGNTRYGPMDELERQESIALAKRLERFVNLQEADKEIVISPPFNGCGIVDDCEGDLLIGTRLYEVKNVERDFRLVDIRQLICYCALNRASRRHAIDSVGLVNARRGVFYRIDFNYLCLAVAGMTAPDLCAEVTNFISSDFPSR